MIEAMVNKMVLPYNKLVRMIQIRAVIVGKLLPAGSESANWREVGPLVSLGSQVVGRYHPRESEALVSRCSGLC